MSFTARRVLNPAPRDQVMVSASSFVACWRWRPVNPLEGSPSYLEWIEQSVRKA